MGKATVEAEDNLVSHINPRVTCNVGIARTLATLKHIVGPSKYMSRSKPISPSKLRMKVSCSWLILPLLTVLMVFGLFIVDGRIVCLVQSLYLEILMSQKRVNLDSMMTSKYVLKANVPQPSKQCREILH
ncbi:hypothetical protein RDI58_028933 [Solanum bulbocastanum]|uniref:Uncharacterized protein n=1 Tax=Solanum bulbocastanum TaxID=147425 RepID=A0AAN8XZ54_SOLBU